jgi:uncharacterized protein (DUF697 family)
MAGSSGVTRQIWKAIRQLSPGKVLKESEQRFNLAVVASDSDQAEEMRAFLLGRSPSEEDTARLDRVLRLYLQPVSDSQVREMSKDVDIVLASVDAHEGLERLAARMVTYHPEDPAGCIDAILNSDAGAMIRLSLARNVPVLRPEVARRIVRQISLENATFAIGTALGNVVPSVLGPILGVAEAAGDIVVLTANQVRMMFMIGAGYGRKVGLAAQWKEISSIAGAAFTWRALARNLVSKIPFGGGLVPKGAIAYAGTFSIGEGLVYYYTTGRRMTREEAARTFRSAFSGSIERVRGLVKRLKKDPDTERSGDRDLTA